MATLVSEYGAMAKKKDQHISPYLRRPLRPFEEAQREQTQGKKRPDRDKPPANSVTEGPADKASINDPDNC